MKNVLFKQLARKSAETFLQLQYHIKIVERNPFLIETHSMFNKMYANLCKLVGKSMQILKTLSSSLKYIQGSRTKFLF